jgi:hypothetical protein
VFAALTVEICADLGDEPDNVNGNETSGLCTVRGTALLNTDIETVITPTIAMLLDRKSVV